LATWNGLTVDASLQPRMVLQAFVAPTWSEDQARVALLDETRLVIVTRGSKEHLELSEGRSGRQRVEYVAPKRESYEQIGKRFGLSKRDMARINRKPPDTMVDKGELVVVYKVVDRTRSERAQKQWKQAPKGPRKGSGKGPGKKVTDAGDAAGGGGDAAAGGDAAVAVDAPEAAPTQARVGDGPPTRKRGGGDDGKAEAGKAEAAKPEAGKAEAAKPEAGKAEAGKAEAAKPEAGKPEAPAVVVEAPDDSGPVTTPQ
jgi:hypothetical protein